MKLLSSNALGKMQYSQEHFKTMVYAKFGGKTGFIVGDSTIENEIPGELSRENMISSHVKKNMLSSHVKRSPLLWLHNKSRLSKQKTI